MRFYKLMMSDAPRWHLSRRDNLGGELPTDIWAFCRCEPFFGTLPIRFDITKEGPAVDYNPTAFCSTVVSDKMAHIISTSAEGNVQLIDACVGCSMQWKVLNVLRCVDCIDHGKSIIQYFPPNHSEKPNLPRGVIKLVIDPTKSEHSLIFKPLGWKVVDIVSESLKLALEANHITGIHYCPVTDS